MIRAQLGLGQGEGAHRALIAAMLGALAAMAGLAGCAPLAAPGSGVAAAKPTVDATGGATVTPTAEPAEAEGWMVTRVVDGDTLDVTDGASAETVRLLGIDTPERGDCGFDAASEQLSDLVGVQAVTLTAGGSGQDNKDHYGRILRYVEVGGVDVGLALLEQGYAISRYDSRDGYGAHPRERAYVAADEAVAATGCPAPEPILGSPPDLVTEAPDVALGPYANCAAARSAGAAPVHRGEPGYSSALDRDHDGTGCE